MNTQKLQVIIQYRKHIKDMQNLILKTFKVDDFKLPTVNYINDVTKCLNIIAEKTNLHITIYFYKTKKENFKYKIDNKFESTNTDYYNKIKFSVKKNKVDFIVDKQIDKMFYKSRNKNQTTAIYEHEKKYYNFETLKEIKTNEKFYTIKLIDKEDFNEQVESHKKSIEKIKVILNKYNIDENIIKRANYIPDNIMISLLSHMFNKYRCSSIDDEIEKEYLEKCYAGPLTGYKTGEYNEKYYKYDYNGFYLNLLKKQLVIPIGGAEVKNTYEDGDVGMYHLKVKKLPYFYKQKTTHFTNYDIMLFDAIGIEYEIISGIVYKHYINCSEILDMQVFNDLYENRNDVIKNMYKKWWGTLSMKNIIVGVNPNDIRYGDEVFDYDREKDKYSIKPGCFTHLYKTKLFRIKYYINSYARLMMGMKIHKLEQKGFNVVRVQTDSIITNAPPENFNISKKLGKFKLEEEFENINVVNFIDFGEFDDYDYIESKNDDTDDDIDDEYDETSETD